MINTMLIRKILVNTIKCGAILGIFYTVVSMEQAYANQENQEKQEKQEKQGEHKENQVFSIRLKQAPLVATLQQLASEQNVNLIIDDELKGTISLQLEETDLDLLFRSVAKIKQLDLHQENGIYYINQGNKSQKSLTTSMKISDPEPMVDLYSPELTNIKTASIKLHFAKASEVMKSLTTGTGSLLSPTGSLSFDDRSNRLIIKDDPKNIKQLRKLIAELDKPIEQIAIEARIVTMSDESLQELGVRWGMFGANQNAHKVSGSLTANGFEKIADNLNVNFAGVNSPSVRETDLLLQLTQENQ